MARIFSPDDYGTVVIITIFTALLQVFVDGGLGSALIQKKDADDVDFSTVFYTNVIQVSALCGMLYNELRLKMERNIVFEL